MKKGELAFAFPVLAEWTGLEPATSGVTGQHSNQLNYRSELSIVLFCAFHGDCSWCRYLASPRGFEPLLPP